MSLTKIIKNNSGNAQNCMSRNLLNGESYTVPMAEWLQLAQSPDVAALVGAGTLVVNDGSSDLSVANALTLISRFQFDSADKISFVPTATNAATTVQDAITASTMATNTLYLSSTSTVSTTSGTYGTISDMTVTPGAGVWVGIFTGNFRSTGVNTNGDLAIHVGGVKMGETTRQQYDNAAILGLVTLSTNEGASSAAIVFKRTFTGSEQVTVKFREISGGTTYVDNRTFLLFQVGA